MSLEWDKKTIRKIVSEGDAEEQWVNDKLNQSLLNSELVSKL